MVQSHTDVLGGCPACSQACYNLFSIPRSGAKRAV